MGIVKKLQRWLRDPRKSAVRRPINQRSPVPMLNTQTITANTSRTLEARTAEKPLSEREEISRRMKEMVGRSTEMRSVKNTRSPQNLNVYQERVSSRLERVPTRNPRSNGRHQ
jgi:hypothetical protein